MMSGKIGHYMVFFPSYKYMQAVYEVFKEKSGVADEWRIEETPYFESQDELGRGFKVYQQEVQMSEEQREAFLERFEPSPKVATVNFCVLGGIFSEGIDLTGDRLIGVMVVGVGLPQLGLERDLIKHYFDERQVEGYHYAYTYPGINKVLQAVGRLVRTETDEGVIILVDDRYQQALYSQLLPSGYQRVHAPERLKVLVENFWEKRSEG